MYEAGLALLSEFGRQTDVRGRFVALYLGLRRLDDSVASLGAAVATPASEIEHALDTLFTKTNRPEPFVVLTAPFGGSTSPNAPYSTRSGETAPEARYPTNTWRNNFGIQKGIGCPAEPAVIMAILGNPTIRLSCPHMAVDVENRFTCSIRDTTYRGDEHSIWLRSAMGGYQVVDLNLPAVYGGYLNPKDQRIPIFPLIAVLYSFSSAGVYPNRQTTGIPDFASDFAFTLNQVQELFDCDPDSVANAALLAIVEGTPLDEPGTPPDAVPEEDEPDLPLLGEPVELNSGVGAELAVAKNLQSHGWHVVYRANQRNLGYDLEVTLDDVTLRVEVKSSVGFTTPILTQSEWDAAQTYGEEYVLAVVDFYKSDSQTIWYVRNPAGSVIPAEVSVMTFRLPRADLTALQTDADFL